MHEQAVPLIHGDIKPENVLLEADFNPLLSDVATMKRFDIDSTTTVEINRETSVYLRSPEVWCGASKSVKTDVYAFGINIAWVSILESV